jgi:hypothetical protein
MKDDIKPELPDAIRGGVYASFFSVSINPEFAVIDFGNNLPEPGGTVPERNVIVSRIITSKNGAKQLADLIYEIINKSESQAVK